MERSQADFSQLFMQTRASAEFQFLIAIRVRRAAFVHSRAILARAQRIISTGRVSASSRPATRDSFDG